jgi:hypothetical protein
MPEREEICAGREDCTIFRVTLLFGEFKIAKPIGGVETVIEVTDDRRSLYPLKIVKSHRF